MNLHRNCSHYNYFFFFCFFFDGQPSWQQKTPLVVSSNSLPPSQPSSSSSPSSPSWCCFNMWPSCKGVAHNHQQQQQQQIQKSVLNLLSNATDSKRNHNKKQKLHKHNMTVVKLTFCFSTTPNQTGYRSECELWITRKSRARGRHTKFKCKQFHVKSIGTTKKKTIKNRDCKRMQQRFDVIHGHVWQSVCLSVYLVVSYSFQQENLYAFPKNLLQMYDFYS